MEDSSEFKPMRFDRLDVATALSVWAVVTLWAFLWSYPYPHPETWSVLASAAGGAPADVPAPWPWRGFAGLLMRMFSVETAVALLGVSGKVLLGFCAGLGYLAARRLWMSMKPDEAGDDDPFFNVRLSAALGPVALAFTPPAWRAAQFLTPTLVTAALGLVAFFFWLTGRRCRSVGAYTTAFFFAGLMASVSFVAVVFVVAVVLYDTFSRYRETRVWNDRYEAVNGILAEKTGATIGFLVGLALGVGVEIGLRRVFGGGMGGDVAGSLSAWWGRTWGAFTSGLSSPAALCAWLVAPIAAGLTALAIKLCRFPEETRFVRGVLMAVLIVATAVFALRSVGRSERPLLAVFGEWAREVAQGAEGTDFLFSDGVFDDAVRLEVAARGGHSVVTSLLNVPTAAESAMLKTLASSPEERPVFAAGGSEIFGAWVRERDARLSSSAWQLGGGRLRMHGVDGWRLEGSVMRMDGEGRDGASANERVADLSKRALALDDLREGGALLGPADETTSRKFDLLLWRLSRLADERSDTDMVRELTVRVRSLRGYADFVERLLPADRLILTPSEELDVTLKRADFKLAARAARAVLVKKPGDARAHFALGMNELEERGYGQAARHFEAVLAVTPDEPAVLNNLAVAYFRLGRKDEARELIEKALKLHPSSEQVRAVYREITGERPPAVR